MPKPFDPSQEKAVREIVKEELARAMLRRSRQPDVELHVFTIDSQAPPCGEVRVEEIFLSYRTFTPVGVRSFNDFHDIEVVSVRDAQDNEQAIMPFNSAAYRVPDLRAPAGMAEFLEDIERGGNSRRLYHPVKWGTATKEAPISVHFRTIGTPTCLPHLMWVIYGLVD
jgi:hypothetical protein